MTEAAPSGSRGSRWPLLGYALATCLAIFTYFYGLDSDHIPKNGDENVYFNIARLTALSGHWLPLQAGEVQMRNTKPPLLFWQGILATDWASDWTLWRLRCSSVVYTLLTGLLIYLLGAKLSGRRETGFLGLLIFLAFFSTYRYGRPFLTDAPVVFWLFLPVFVLLYWQPLATQSLFLVPLLLGAAVGVGLLYKSFALLVPVVLCLAWWYLHQRGNRLGQILHTFMGPADAPVQKSSTRSAMSRVTASGESQAPLGAACHDEETDRRPMPLLEKRSVGGRFYKPGAPSGALAHVGKYGISGLGQFLAKDALKLTIISVLSLSVFGLWFLLDPRPDMIWQDFIVGENMSKFDAKGGGYLSKLLWGGSSIWRLVVSYPINAGLLAFPVVGLCWIAFRRRKQLYDAEKLLWVWILALFLFFSLPTQRDERYLLPGMPALAVLCALNWQRITRKAFVATLVVIGVGAGVLAYLSVRLQLGAASARLYPPAYWLLLAGIVLLVVLALWLPRLTRPGATVGALLMSLVLAAFMRPLDGPVGTYDANALHYAEGKSVWVPINFRGKEEGYRFLLPGADVRGYKYNRSLTASALSERYPLFVFRLPLADAAPAGVQVIGQRLDLGSRHSSKQIMEMVRGRVFEHLFLKELLIAAPAPGTNDTSAPATGLEVR